MPIAPGTKNPPVRLKWKPYQHAPPDEARVRKWFGGKTDYGIAVILGEVSGGLVCRDFDTAKGYDGWAAEHPDLARTLPTVATVRGRHVYFRAAAADLRYVDLRKREPPEDGEYRGDSGHYCVLPPSKHPARRPAAVYRERRSGRFSQKLSMQQRGRRVQRERSKRRITEEYGSN
jgi:hypothetical protein